MLAQIKGIKIMGLTDYVAKLVQNLRVRELNLSKKFRAYIIRILVIGKCHRLSCLFTVAPSANNILAGLLSQSI